MGQVVPWDESLQFTVHTHTLAHTPFLSLSTLSAVFAVSLQRGFRPESIRENKYSWALLPTIISGKELHLLKPENIFKKLIIFLAWFLERPFLHIVSLLSATGYYSCGTYGVPYKTKLLLILLKISLYSLFYVYLFTAPWNVSCLLPVETFPSELLLPGSQVPHCRLLRDPACWDRKR